MAASYSVPECSRPVALATRGGHRRRMNRDFWRERRVFVTGHSGFKGSWLTRWLGLLGASVTGYSLPDDVRDLPALGAALAAAEPDIVFHLAAQALVRASYEDPVGTFSTNAMGTVNLMEALRRASSVRAAILVTSDKCYANSGDARAFREDDKLGGDDPYSGSKACAEIAIQSYRRSFFAGGPLIVSVRAGNVIGGGDWSQDRLVPDLVRAFRDGRPAAIRYPDATRPWQFVLDALHGYLLAAEHAFAGEDMPEAFNFGPDAREERTVRWLADAMAARWGEGSAWRVLDAPQPAEAPTLALDSARARLCLGWTPLLGAESAVTWTADWYKSGRDLTAEQIRLFMDLIAR
jgi:CDP-glucose 4,6-dehydratase